MKVTKISSIDLSELNKRAKRDRTGLLKHLLVCYETVFLNACDPNSDILEFKSFDMVLHCPKCGKQHIDEAEPDNCESCGHSKEYHGRELIEKQHNSECLHCSCAEFKAWLNPPHKSHRCHACNHVWRPANIPTNGVKELK